MSYGKWIGGALGWALGGPIGALMGVALGTLFDDKSEVTTQTGNQSQRTTRRHNTSSGDFAASLLVLSAAVMKADGKILKSELEYVKQFYVRQFGKDTASQQMLVLKDLLKRDIPVRQVAEQIRFYMEHPARLQLLQYLFGIASADNEVASSELSEIERIAGYMGISFKDYESIKAMFVKNSADAFKILELEESASDDEIKKAYRRMAKKYHPDKVRGIGEAHEEAAKVKFQKLQEAYETIKKQRGIK